MLQSQKSQYSTTHHHDKTQHLVHIKSQPKFFNSQLADQTADYKLSGGYKTQTCSIHFIKLSVSGECIECD